MGVVAPCFPAVPHLVLPDGNRRLDRVDAESRRREGVGPMRRRDDDHDGGRTDRHDTDAMQERDAADRRAIGRAPRRRPPAVAARPVPRTPRTPAAARPGRSGAWSRAVPLNSTTAPQSGRTAHSVARPTGNSSSPSPNHIVAGRRWSHARIVGEQGPPSLGHVRQYRFPPCLPTTRVTTTRPRSALRCHPTTVCGGIPPSSGRSRGSPSVTTEGEERRSSSALWGVAVVAGLVGAALSLGVVAMAGGFQSKVVEKPVVEKVPVRTVADLDVAAERCRRRHDVRSPLRSSGSR